MSSAAAAQRTETRLAALCLRARSLRIPTPVRRASGGDKRRIACDPTGLASRGPGYREEPRDLVRPRASHRCVGQEGTKRGGARTGGEGRNLKPLRRKHPRRNPSVSCRARFSSVLAMCKVQRGGARPARRQRWVRRAPYADGTLRDGWTPE
ncbi:hypothetical protein VTK73DRAFT_4851 [Phialemonium thermophilum]|uniref:Uncharacterized protein n=1 Tax=Phialemonium thermophilum TaxID=223376 RepID=A0ABR3WRD3_9PEZI